MLDKGLDLDERAPSRATGPVDHLSGWGGAGAFSDGKLTMFPTVGGILCEYISKSEMKKLIRYVDDLYVRFGAPRRLYGIDEDRIVEI
jgi:hypothetical protein